MRRSDFLFYILIFYILAAGAWWSFLLYSKNKEIFEANPEKYAPAFGGFCAIAMSEGSTVEINPKAFVIQNDRLLLFYAKRVAGQFVIDTRTQWAQDPDKFFALAESVYKKFLTS